jgi:hypothetical protein
MLGTITKILAHQATSAKQDENQEIHRTKKKEGVGLEICLSPAKFKINVH